MKRSCHKIGWLTGVPRLRMLIRVLVMYQNTATVRDENSSKTTKKITFPNKCIFTITILTHGTTSERWYHSSIILRLVHHQPLNKSHMIRFTIHMVFNTHTIYIRVHTIYNSSGHTIYNLNWKRKKAGMVKQEQIQKSTIKQQLFGCVHNMSCVSKQPVYERMKWKKRTSIHVKFTLWFLRQFKDQIYKILILWARPVRKAVYTAAANKCAVSLLAPVTCWTFTTGLDKWGWVQPPITLHMCYHNETEIYLPPFRRRHFQIHLLEWKYMNFA